MSTNAKAGYTVKLTRTLYDNTYRAELLDEFATTIGHLRIVPGIPLPPSAVPEGAPRVPYFLLVLVDDADINKDNLIDFEEKASYALLKRFANDSTAPQHCQFYYPSPAFVFEQKDAVDKPFTFGQN